MSAWLLSAKLSRNIATNQRLFLSRRLLPPPGLSQWKAFPLAGAGQSAGVSSSPSARVGENRWRGGVTKAVSVRPSSEVGLWQQGGSVEGGQEQLSPWPTVLLHAGLLHLPCSVIVVVLSCQWSRALIVIMV